MVATGGVWSGERRALTTGLVLTITLVGLEALAVATIMPEVKDDLGGLGLYGWVFSAFPLAQMVGIVFAGQSADRYGPAKPFALGLALFGAGLLLGGLAPSMLVLVAARAIQGFGAGAIPSIAYVTIGRAYPESLRPRMFAVLSTAWVVPGVIGPGLAGIVAESIGWRWVFLGLLPFVLVPGVVTVRALARIGPGAGDDAARGRLPTAIRVAIGAGVAMTGLTADDLLVVVVLVVVGVAVLLPAFRRLTPPGTLRAAPGFSACGTVPPGEPERHDNHRNNRNQHDEKGGYDQIEFAVTNRSPRVEQREFGYAAAAQKQHWDERAVTEQFEVFFFRHKIPHIYI